MLISSTIPSNVLSVLKLFLKLTCCEPAGTAISRTGQFREADRGRVRRERVVGRAEGRCRFRHPRRLGAAGRGRPAGGSAGATTPSKFSENAVVVTNVPSVKLKTAVPEVARAVLELNRRGERAAASQGGIGRKRERHANRRSRRQTRRSSEARRRP